MIDSIGSQLKAARLRLGLTQGDVAVRAQIGKAAVSKLELNYSEPSLSTVRRIARALGYDVAMVLIKKKHGNG